MHKCVKDRDIEIYGIMGSKQNKTQKKKTIFCTSHRNAPLQPLVAIYHIGLVETETERGDTLSLLTIQWTVLIQNVHVLYMHVHACSRQHWYVLYMICMCLGLQSLVCSSCTLYSYTYVVHVLPPPKYIFPWVRCHFQPCNRNRFPSHSNHQIALIHLHVHRSYMYKLAS